MPCACTRLPGKEMTENIKNQFVTFKTWMWNIKLHLKVFLLTQIFFSFTSYTFKYTSFITSAQSLLQSHSWVFQSITRTSYIIESDCYGKTRRCLRGQKYVCHFVSNNKKQGQECVPSTLCPKCLLKTLQ